MPLYLVDKKDRKLFQEGYKCLNDKDVFTRAKQGYGNFVKLIETDFGRTRTMEALEIYTEWNTAGGMYEAIRVPTEEGKIKIFTSNKASNENVYTHCDLVWDTTAFGASTPKYFKRFSTAPIDDPILNDAYNTMKIKHIIMGMEIWNSLSSELKIEISGSKQEFKRDQ